MPGVKGSWLWLKGWQGGAVVGVCQPVRAHSMDEGDLCQGVTNHGTIRTQGYRGPPAGNTVCWPLVLVSTVALTHLTHIASGLPVVCL